MAGLSLRRSIPLAAAILAVAIVVHGHWTRYTLSAAGDVVWRIDEATGQVSHCGAAMTGSAFSQAKIQSQESLRRIVLAEKPAESNSDPKLPEWIKPITPLDNWNEGDKAIKTLSLPWCSSWSAR